MTPFLTELIRVNASYKLINWLDGRSVI